jgi:SRSO17 transposase
VLADSAYGDSSGSRAALREHGLDYAVAIKSPTCVWMLDAASGRLPATGRQLAGRCVRLGRPEPKSVALL